MPALTLLILTRSPGKGISNLELVAKAATRGRKLVPLFPNTRSNNWFYFRVTSLDMILSTPLPTTAKKVLENWLVLRARTTLLSDIYSSNLRIITTFKAVHSVITYKDGSRLS